jgi:hypothetical protein
MDKCVVCNKTYKNASTLKAHYNTNTHKQQVELSAASGNVKAIDNVVPVSKQQVPCEQATQQQAPCEQATNQAPCEQATQQQAPKTRMTNPELANLFMSAVMALDENEENCEYMCVACTATYKKFQDLEKHQYVCSSFAAAVFFALHSGINLGICLKILMAQKIKDGGPGSNIWKVKLEEFVRVEAAFDIDVQRKMNLNLDPASNINFDPNKSYNWTNYVSIRPVFEENMISVIKPQTKKLLVESGKECFKTLIDIIYELPENKNWYLTDTAKGLAVVINVDGEVSVINATELLARIVNNQVYYLINLFINMGQPLMEIYNNLGINITAEGNNISYSSQRMPEYMAYICDKSLSYKKQAIININSFNTLRNKILGADKTKFLFEKSSLYTYDIVNTYVQLLPAEVNIGLNPK